MGKVKIKRKSTLIDMTAMSDVTVLLLTFFMLTSTFLQKEPVTVVTPSSVSEEKVPIENVSTVLISPEGKIFISIAGTADEETKDELGTEATRAKVLKKAAAEYEKITGKNLGITESDVEKFSKSNMFGVPLENMHAFFELTQVQQDQFLGNMENEQVGIPMKPIKGGVKGKSENEFQIWMTAIYGSNDNIKDAILSGEGVAVKADHNTPYSTIKATLDNLRDLKMNKFIVMTALKSEAD